MRGDGPTTKCMGRGSLNRGMELFMRGTIVMVNDMGSECYSGQMAVDTREGGRMGSSMEEGSTVARKE